MLMAWRGNDWQNHQRNKRSQWRKSVAGISLLAGWRQRKWLKRNADGMP